MDRKKSKYLSETKFWAFGSLKAEKTRGGHNGPPMWIRYSRSHVEQGWYCLKKRVFPKKDLDPKFRYQETKQMAFQIHTYFMTIQ